MEVLSRHTDSDANITRTQLQGASPPAGRAATCAQHAEMHEHSKVCADACRACDKACQELLDTIG